MMIIKKFLAFCVICFLATPVYAGEAEQHQSCVKALTKDDKPEHNSPEAKAVVNKWCDCLIIQANLHKNTPDKKVDGNKISENCFFTATLHRATDNLEDDTTSADLMAACKGMLDFTKENTEDDTKMLDTFCKCAHPKLWKLFEEYDSITEKQYDDGVYSVVDKCAPKL